MGDRGATRRKQDARLLTYAGILGAPPGGRWAPGDRSAFAVEHRPLDDPNQLLVWFAEAAGDVPAGSTPRPDGTTWTMDGGGPMPDGMTIRIELLDRQRPPIVGASDAPDGVSNGHTTSGPSM